MDLAAFSSADRRLLSRKMPYALLAQGHSTVVIGSVSWPDRPAGAEALFEF
jgi:hypothetical protein